MCPLTVRRRPICWTACLWLTLQSAWAVDPALRLTQYVHTKWTRGDQSSIASVTALAQTADGFLWVGADLGLLRFDGAKFQLDPYSAKIGRSISALRVTAGGDLWVGSSSGLFRRNQTEFQALTAANGLPPGAITQIVETGPGRLAISLSGRGGGGLAAVEGGSVRRLAGASDVPTIALMRDKEHRLWAGTARGLCEWIGDKLDCGNRAPMQVVSMTESGGGIVLYDALSRRIMHYGQGQWRPMADAVRNHSLSVRTLFHDREGSLWIGTIGQGLLRLRDGGVEQFTRRDGLSSDTVYSIFEDAQGNIWIGTNAGLDQFRNPEVPRLSVLEGLSSDSTAAVLVDPRNGEAWIGTTGGGLNRRDGAALSSYTLRDGLPSTSVTAIGRNGVQILFATTGGLVRWTGGSLAQVRTSPPLTNVMMIEPAREGGFWLIDARAGLRRLAADGSLHPPEVAMPPGKRPYHIQATKDGSLWVGFFEGGVVRLANGRAAEEFPAGQAIAPGPVYAIREDTAGSLWVGTERGLSRLRAGRWTTWTGSGHGVPDGGFLSILQDNAGFYWLTAPRSLYRISADELQRQPDGRPGPLPLVQVGASETLRFVAGSSVNPRASKGPDGRLWLATSQGLIVLDPLHLFQAPPVARPVIESIAMDDRELAWQESPRGVRGQQLRIRFTSAYLFAPDSVRFRYRMVGFSDRWETAESREVSYLNLSPGSYRFEVQASNDGGRTWASPVSVAVIRLEPYFYQTWPFFLMLLLGLAGIAGVLYRLRVGRIRRRFELILAERSRLTRELHDTLLQGFNGVVYLLAAASKQLESAPQISRAQLQRAIAQADESLRETRIAIAFMRVSAHSDSPLPDAVAEAGARLTAGTALRFECTVSGEPRPFDYQVETNLYMMAREAITNAVKHAGAARILASFDYEEDSLRLLIADDGDGMDLAAAASRRNSWGITGMRERAKAAQAVLDIRSKISHGTEVEIRVVRPRSWLQRLAVRLRKWLPARDV